jgi:HK97 family phage major capsid protein
MTMTTPEAGAAFDELMRAFEEYKETNDRRVGGLERRGAADPVDDDKLARLDATLDDTRRRLDELQLKAARPPLGAAERATFGPAAEHKAAFEAYVRSGETAGLKRLEEKAMTNATEGAYIAPPEIETEVMRRLSVASPIRSLASVRTVSSGTYSKPYSPTGPAANWVAETAARPETTSPPLAQLSYATYELYAAPAATQALLEDSAVNIDQWIADEVEQVFAEKEGSAFVAGDGLGKPTGFLTPTKSTIAAWSWGKIAYLPTGQAGGFLAATPSDNLVDLVYALKAGYRQNATFVMNKKTQSVIRKLKDTTGAYLWAPPATADARAMLMNFQIAESEDMPDIATDSFSIAFGDFRRGYLVVDRRGLSILRDPYSAKPNVLFYTTKRVGGGVQDFDAIKLLKFGTS